MEDHKLTPFPKGTTKCLFGYYEYLPEDFSTRTDWPIVIFTHGTSEGGDGSLTSLNTKSFVNGPLKMIKAGKKFPFIIIAPQSKDGGFYTTTDLTGLDFKTGEKVAHYSKCVLPFIKEKYGASIDQLRIYATGLSAGGKAVFQLAGTCPDEIAAILPICPASGSTKESNITKVPAWIFHNDSDPKINISVSKDLFAKVSEVAEDKSKVILTTYNSTSHDAWTKTYNEQATWDWLLAQRKPEPIPAPIPEPIVIKPDPITVEIKEGEYILKFSEEIQYKVTVAKV